MAPKDDTLGFGVLEASYTDLGREGASPLSGKATIRVRSRRVEAEHADEISGPQQLGGAQASGKKFLGAIADGHTLRFPELHLGGSPSLTCRVASGGSGGVVEFRAGSVKGELLASVEVKPTGGWDQWVELSAPLAPSTGWTDLYVVFANPGKSGLMNLDWVRFDKPEFSKTER
jgi:hypothetical protein